MCLFAARSQGFQAGQLNADHNTRMDTPFPEVRKNGGTNLPPSKIRKIQQVRQAGFKVDRIAEEVGVDRSTVYRWGRRSRKDTEDRR